ncbi:hypothetical protein SDC9_88233 [bioreactor metagenome]|uniref:Uncharacterized protein n=1 Tax=bioreactor metagenome TaxID=1076179 RepID=A0A644ZMI3_9ZZZZ
MIKLVLGQSSFNESPGIHAWGRVTLEVDQVCTVFRLRTLEEPVESHFIHRGGG